MYCEASDILPIIDEERVKRILGIDDSEELSEDDIQPFIDACTDEINATLGAHYIIPITGQQSLYILKGIAVGLTLSFIYLSSGVILVNPTQEGEVPPLILARINRSRQMLDDYGGIISSSGVKASPIKFLPDATGYQGTYKMVAPSETDYSST